MHAHPFELAGMGTGPYRFVGVAEIPSASLAEANPSAYNGALASLPRDLIGGCGTCSNCGMAIRMICIVQDAQGKRYGVGSDCIRKTEDPCLADKAKIAVARIARQKRRDAADRRRHAAHEAYMNKVCNEAGETNAQRIEREILEHDERMRRQIQEVTSKWAFVLPVLDASYGDFAESIASGIRNGNAPHGRANDIVREIYSKQHGRMGSKAYDAATEEFDSHFQS